MLAFFLSRRRRSANARVLVRLDNALAVRHVDAVLHRVETRHDR